MLPRRWSEFNTERGGYPVERPEDRLFAIGALRLRHVPDDTAGRSRRSKHAYVWQQRSNDLGRTRTGRTFVAWGSTELAGCQGASATRSSRRARSRSPSCASNGSSAHVRPSRRVALEGSLISLAAVLGTEVKDSAGATIGQLRDVVVRWTRAGSYPAVTAIVVRAGKRDAVIGARWVELSGPSSVRLHSSAVYAHAIDRHPADVALAHDVLDRQVVDADGVQIVRPSDVYLATVDGRIDLVGIEVGIRALLRRLGPKRLRSRFRPDRVIDWATIRSFSPARADGLRFPGRRSDLAGQAGSGLLLDGSTGEVRRLRASEIEAALRSAQTDPIKKSR